MPTRHVWLLPPLGVGEPRQGFVLEWRKVEQRTGPPQWQARVLFVRGEQVVVEWWYAVYLVPVVSEGPGMTERPAATRR
ncbi:MAG: hypothetical protein J7518_20395 [Nocardioidaceae bacterium]|nr:hypothetical protein [Nocardioidaceae bacterium]